MARFALWWVVFTLILCGGVLFDAAYSEFCWYWGTESPCSVWSDNRDWYYAQTVREKIEAQREAERRAATIVR